MQQNALSSKALTCVLQRLHADPFRCGLTLAESVGASCERLAEYGWKPHRVLVAPKNQSQAPIYWYVRETQGGTISSSSRFQAVYYFNSIPPASDPAEIRCARRGRAQTLHARARAKRVPRPTGTCHQFQDCLKSFSSEVYVSLEG